MDALHIAPARPHRRRIGGRAALARAARRRRDAPPPVAPVVAVAPFGALVRAEAAAPSRVLDVVAVARGIGARPALRALLVGVFIASLVQVGAGAAGLGIRSTTKARRTDVTAVAVATAEAALPEDLPPPPLPPPPPPAISAPAPTSAPTPTPPTALPSTSPPLPLAAPSVAGVAGGVPGFGFAGSGASAGSGAAAVTSTRPTATAAPSPAVTPARPLRRTPPRFPPEARRDGRTGVVVVQLRVDESGAVVDARVVQSDPPGVFDAAALESARGWSFSPATSDGQPIASWVRQTIRFTLEGT